MEEQQGKRDNEPILYNQPYEGQSQGILPYIVSWDEDSIKDNIIQCIVGTNTTKYTNYILQQEYDKTNKNIIEKNRFNHEDCIVHIITSPYYNDHFIIVSEQFHANLQCMQYKVAQYKFIGKRQYIKENISSVSTPSTNFLLYNTNTIEIIKLYEYISPTYFDVFIPQYILWDTNIFTIKSSYFLILYSTTILLYNLIIDNEECIEVKKDIKEILPNKIFTLDIDNNEIIGSAVWCTINNSSLPYTSQYTANGNILYQWDLQTSLHTLNDDISTTITIKPINIYKNLSNSIIKCISTNPSSPFNILIGSTLGV